MTDLVKHVPIESYVSLRDASIAKMEEAIQTLTLGFRQADEARELARQAYGNAAITETKLGLPNRSGETDYRNLFNGSWDPEGSLAVFKKSVDAKTWLHLMDVSGMNSLMDAKEKSDLYDSLSSGNVPEVTVDTIRATFERLYEDREVIFARGVARAFTALDRRFKSHDGFKVGTRMIFTNILDEWGHVRYGSDVVNALSDVERAFSVLDGNANVHIGAALSAIQSSRQGWGAHQSQAETDYFRIRCFINGNVHLWFKRDDLVERVNLVLADFYGAVLPDAVTKETTVEDLRTNGALSKDLAFYPTPPEVCELMLREVPSYNDYIGSLYPNGIKVLEPSAGTGNLVQAFLDKVPVAEVTAIEVDAVRADTIRARFRGNHNVRTLTQNFLAMRPVPEYDYVVMNPPFCDTHWMEHVIHAFGFLNEGGQLLAVLPVTAQLRETKDHVAFREWAKSKAPRWGSVWRDLPEESFKSSGTRINTVVLNLCNR